MPYIHVRTNTAVPADRAEAVKSAMGQAITTIPGKSEHWLMVGIEPEQMLWFQGTSDPAAMVEVSVFGGASASAYDALTGRICSILDEKLSIPSSRIYVKYAETPNWGWNGGNF